MGKWGDKSIEGQSHSLTLGKGHSDFKIQTCFFSETSVLFETKFHMKAHGRKQMKIYSNKFGHMTMMATMTIYGKNSSKIFFSRTTSLIALKLGM